MKFNIRGTASYIGLVAFVLALPANNASYELFHDQVNSARDDANIHVFIQL